MRRTDTIIIGGGQAGLAMSRCLTEQSVDHVVLERGRIAERWRSERWDSLRLLSPRWQCQLPGFRYRGPEPEGFMSMPELIGYFERYAQSFSAPVKGETNVLSVERLGDGYRVRTDQGDWRAPNVVIATGHCDTPQVPALARNLSPSVHQLVPTRYRNPSQLPDGGVLVVGASATGIQLAQEIQASGRPVTLAVGRHNRLPRQYRGQDIMWWLEALGVWDERADEVFDLQRSRRQPSLQLLGRPDHRSIDLGVLQDEGIRLTGRARAADADRFVFEDDLGASLHASEQKLRRMLSRIDAFIDGTRLKTAARPVEPVTTIVAKNVPSEIRLHAEGIRTVLWATGYRRRYPWLKLPVLDARGELIHDGGITASPGLVVLGLNFLRRRKSSFIDGVGQDARELSEHLVQRLDRQALAA